MNIYITPKNELLLRQYAKQQKESMSGLVNHLLDDIFDKDLHWLKKDVAERLNENNVPVDIDDAPVRNDYTNPSPF